jgi:exoribonuclease R
MLPKLLTETLCSLRDDGDRLAFSCLVELDR